MAALVTNAAGNVLGWGVAAPLFAVAVLRTEEMPRWVGWLGLLVGVLAGWLGLLSPVSGILEAISSIGFLALVAFMLSMGVTMLHRRERADTRMSPTPP